ncbi:MAG TPA: hypothetical protein VFB74_36025 [Kribbellaceae bacterium]|nr:hypothetical protein [Kribbellaceae bacterium]
MSAARATLGTSAVNVLVRAALDDAALDDLDQTTVRLAWGSINGPNGGVLGAAAAGGAETTAPTVTAVNTPTAAMPARLTICTADTQPPFEPIRVPP